MKWQKKEVRTSETSEATKRTRNQLARSPSLPPSGNAFLGKFGRGFWTDRIGQTQGISAGSLSLLLTAVSWFLHRKPSRESDAKTNERASKVKCGGGGRRRPSAASTKSGQSPTDLPNPNFVPFRDPDERYRRRRDDAKYVWCCFVWEGGDWCGGGGGDLFHGRRNQRRDVNWRQH